MNKETDFKTNSQTLARLLANENISVQWGKYRTAAFSVEDRILYMPILKGMSKEICDLFLAHEVGHALYTKSSPSDSEISKMFSTVNIVEDARIEKLIQRKYPGLITIFRNAYKELLDLNFFGIDKLNINDLSFLDRINLKAKCGNLLNVKFSEPEQKLFDRVMKTETWEEVVELSKELHKYCSKEQENKKELTAQSEVIIESDSDFVGLNEEADDGTNGDSDGDTNGDSDDSKTNDKAVENNNKPEEEKETEENNNTVDEPITQSALKNNFEKLADESKKDKTVDVYLPTTEYYKKHIIPYKKFQNSFSRSIKKIPIEDSRFKRFWNKTKKHAAVIVKEFERKKAAHQYSRAKISRSGIINPEKLVNYKFDDQIFKSTMQLANAKSHGLFMVIDLSGSMSPVINEVFNHTMNMVMFCHLANIPFEVYGFTTYSNYRKIDVERKQTIDFNYAKMVEIFSNKMNKNELKNAFKNLFFHMMWRRHGRTNPFLNLGLTPLSESILLSDYLIGKFKVKNKIEIPTALFLTDGSGSPLRINDENGQYLLINPKKIRIHESSTKIIEFEYSNDYTFFYVEQLQEFLFLNLKRKHNINLIGFFISQYGISKQQLLSHLDHLSGENLDKMVLNHKKNITKNGFSTIKNKYGYDTWFIFPNTFFKKKYSDKLDIDSAKMTKSQITSSFKKFNSNKKKQYIFAKEFSQMISSK